MTKRLTERISEVTTVTRVEEKGDDAAEANSDSDSDSDSDDDVPPLNVSS